MKVRHGFVSNSSSSSFTAWIPEDVYNSMGLTPYEKALVKHHMGGREEVFGRPCVTIWWTTGNYDSFEGVDFRDALEEADQELAALGQEPEYEQQGHRVKSDREVYNWFDNIREDLEVKIRALPKNQKLIRTEDI